ncbi:MAG: threonine ammonia-lyase, biosynthetic, partial [Xanthomonadales bacterium]|nr:threonine ammonia-lyase, biosynthetic [Xanthomonadales bacterium]
HYRNHGAADGRVLCGFEVDEANDAAFALDLERLGYWYQEETQHPALAQFVLAAI